MLDSRLCPVSIIMLISHPLEMVHLVVEFVALACKSDCPLVNVSNPYRTADKVYRL